MILTTLVVPRLFGSCSGGHRRSIWWSRNISVTSSNLLISGRIFKQPNTIDRVVLTLAGTYTNTIRDCITNCFNCMNVLIIWSAFTIRDFIAIICFLFQVLLKSSRHMSKSSMYTFLMPWLGTGLLTRWDMDRWAYWPGEIWWAPHELHKYRFV